MARDKAVELVKNMEDTLRQANETEQVARGTLDGVVQSFNTTSTMEVVKQQQVHCWGSYGDCGTVGTGRGNRVCAHL